MAEARALLYQQLTQKHGAVQGEANDRPAKGHTTVSMDKVLGA